MRWRKSQSELARPAIRPLGRRTTTDVMGTFVRGRRSGALVCICPSVGLTGTPR